MVFAYHYVIILLILKNAYKKIAKYHKHLHNGVCVSLRHNTLSPSILAQTCPSNIAKWGEQRWRGRWLSTRQFPLLLLTAVSSVKLIAGCKLLRMSRKVSADIVFGRGMKPSSMYRFKFCLSLS